MNNKIRLSGLLTLAFLGSSNVVQGASPEFLGNIDPAIAIQDMTPDGETIAGRIPHATNLAYDTPVKWHLGTVSELSVMNHNAGSALSINQDASYIGGTGSGPQRANTPVVWNAAGEPNFLPFSIAASIQQAEVHGISNDGTRIAISGYGASGINAYLYQIGVGYLWSASMEGWYGLHMSADGKALAWGNSDDFVKYHYWHEDSGFRNIDKPQFNVSAKTVRGISADGTTVYGSVSLQDACDGICGSSSHSRPFYWTSSHSSHLVPWHNGNYVPTSISDDGKIMIIRTGGSSPVNLIWHQAYGFGLRNWDDVMRDEYQIDWSGWTDVMPLKVSGLGSDITFVGVGNYNANRSIWRVRINYDFTIPAAPSDPEFELISRNMQGYPGFAGSEKPAVSRDGSIVVFRSRAHNLDHAVSRHGAMYKIFVRDQINNTTLAINLDDVPLGTFEMVDSPTVSGDGRWVAYIRRGQMYLFSRNRQTSIVASKNGQGVENLGSVLDPKLSFDGRYLIYTVYSTNMAPEVPSRTTSVVLFDRINNTTQLVSKTGTGEPANAESRQPDVSDNGRFIVYTTAATNIAGAETNGITQVIHFDRETGLSKVVSSASGILGNGNSSNPTITGDGRYVSYISKADNLIDSDVNADSDVFRYDVTTGMTQLVSSFNRFPLQGVIQEPGEIFSVSMSEDGRYITFHKGNDAFQDPAFNNGDIFVRDMQLGTTHLIDYAENPGAGGSATPVITGDGSAVVFSTSKPIIQPDLNDHENDIYKVAVPKDVAPLIEILHPQDGAVFSSIDDLVLDATATDEEGDLSAQIVWSSSIDGDISSPARLSPGVHVLTAQVADSLGQTGNAQVSISVRESFEADLSVKLSKITTAWNVANHDLKLLVSNGGVDPGQGLEVTATLQEGAQFVATQNAECQLAELTATCAFARLPVGGETAVVFSVLLSDPKLKNTLAVSVTSASIDPAPENNASSLRFGGSGGVFMLSFAFVLLWMRRAHTRRS